MAALSPFFCSLSTPFQREKTRPKLESHQLSDGASSMLRGHGRFFFHKCSASRQLDVFSAVFLTLALAFRFRLVVSGVRSQAGRGGWRDT